MSPEITYKDPDELDVIFTMDWRPKLNTGATVISIVSWTHDPAGLTFGSSAIVAGGLDTSIRVSGGTAGTKHIVTNKVTTSDGETLEESGRLYVRASSI